MPSNVNSIKLDSTVKDIDLISMHLCFHLCTSARAHKSWKIFWSPGGGRGAGCLGCHVLLPLIEQGYQLIVFDNFSGGHRSLTNFYHRIKLVEGDLADRQLLASGRGKSD